LITAEMLGKLMPAIVRASPKMPMASLRRQRRHDTDVVPGMTLAHADKRSIGIGFESAAVNEIFPVHRGLVADCHSVPSRNFGHIDFHDQGFDVDHGAGNIDFLMIDSRIR
jgi:hypothetical protein